jgi:splicing factor U2AF subunit
MEDVLEEMEKFGAVDSVEIPRPTPGDPTGGDPPGVGQVFVKFTELATAQTAIDALRSRTFGGKYLTLVFFSEEKFAAKDFTA